MKTLFATAALAALLSTAHAAPPDPSRYALTPQTIQKLKAAEGDMAKAMASDGSEPDVSNLSIEQAAQAIESTPARKAALAKHGLTGLDIALSAHAMFHAGSYLMNEAQMDKAQAAKLLASYTPEQRANIELLRKSAR